MSVREVWKEEDASAKDNVFLVAKDGQQKQAKPTSRSKRD
jgi:hypothetical protein